MTTNPRLDGKVAVVTGAASGIGLATVERFVEEGARVVAADLQEGAGRALAARFPGAVHFVRCDVGRLDELEAAIDAAAARFGGLDILFSNAGSLGSRSGVENFDADTWDLTQAVLLRSVAAGAAYATPHMRRRGGGSIINTSSISALQAGYGPLAYSVAKAGVLHFTKVAAAELSAHRIRINAIVPGFIATSIFGQVYGLGLEDARKMADVVAEGSASANPIGRAGMPLDIAEAAVFLASEGARFVTGTHLTVDGGITMGPRHAWDPATRGPLAETLGTTRSRLKAPRSTNEG